MTLLERIEAIKAEAEAAIEAEKDEVQYLTLCLIVNHRLPALCKALTEANEMFKKALRWPSVAGAYGFKTACEEFDARIAEILQSK